MAADEAPATKKQSSRKRTAKKQDGDRPAKKSAKKGAKKSAKKATGTSKQVPKKATQRGGDSDRRDGRAAPRASAARRPKPLELARSAAEQLAALTGRAPESTTGIERTDEGWRIELEVVETRRIPDSADILALYEVQLEQDGDLLSYRRLRRYPRGRTDPADGGGR